MSVENPQEARHFLSEIEKQTNLANTSNAKLKKHTSYAEFYIANKLWVQAYTHIDSALVIAKKDRDIVQELTLQILLSKSYFSSGEKNLSLKTLSNALKSATKYKDNGLIVKIKIAQADYNKQDGGFTESIKLKKQALNSIPKGNNETIMAECWQSIGSSYWQAGHYNEALENYYKALIAREKKADTLGIIQTLKNIGLTYRELGHYEKGLLNLDRSLSLAQKINNQYEVAEILNITGSLHFRFNRYDEAIKYYNNSLAIREKLRLIRSQTISHINIARALSQKSMFEAALQHLSTALSLQEKIVDPLAESSTLTEMGNLNLQKGNVAEALRRYLMALKLRETYGKDEDIAKSLTNISLAYRQLGMLKNALKYLEQAHDIITSKEINTNDAAYILQNLGHIYLDKKMYAKALNVYKEALTLKEKGGDESGTAKILKNIAQAQLQMHQLNSARASLAQALKISNRIKDTKDIADIYNEMGNVERQANNFDIAINHFNNAAKQYESLSNFNGKALCLRKIGEIQILKKQFSEAEQNIDQSIKTGLQTGNAYLKSLSYLAKHDLYKAKGNFKLALEYYLKHTKINDSLERFKRNETNLEAQLDLELDQKITEIKVMEAEVEALRQKSALDNAIIEKQRTFRNFLIVIVLLFITLTGAAIFGFLQKRKYAGALEEKIDEIKLINDKLKQSETHLKQTVQTKDKLFSIIAHDLRSPFTALVGLSDVLASNANDLSTDEISELSKHIQTSATGVLALTDNLLSWSRSQTGRLTLSPKNYSIKEIVDKVIETALIPANEKGISIDSKIESTISVYVDYDTMTTAVRNLISNAIKFTPTGGNITITAVNHKEHIEILISDTGVGIDPNNLTKLFRVDGITTKGTNQENGTGLGLMLCKEFIEKNNGSIKVESTLGLGTTFRIELPQIQPSNDEKNS
ncbi:MAG: tetratricopeptide repeat protein [Bacteroidales bacterium]